MIESTRSATYTSSGREGAPAPVKPAPRDLSHGTGDDTQHLDSMSRPAVDMQSHLDHLHASDPTLGECIDQFLADLALRVDIKKASWRTLVAYQCHLKHVTPTLRARPVGAVRRVELRAWHKALAERRGQHGRRQGQRLTAAADNILKTLRSVFTWVIDEEIAEIDIPPTHRIKSLHEAGGARALGDDELEAWRDALEVHQHYRTLSVRGLRAGHRRLVRAFNPTVALRLLDLTGARSSEIRELRIEDINFGRRLLLLGRTKTGEGRARPLSEAALSEIRIHLVRLGNPSEGWLFPSQIAKGGCMSDACLTRCFDRVALVAGIKGASRHSLRHTMVTRGFEAGFTSTGTSGAAGHAKEMSFAGYRHAVPRESFDVVEAHSRRSRRAA